MTYPPLVRVVAIIALTVSFSSALRAEPIPALWDLYAGENTIPGHVDGSSDVARFSSPRGLDIDRSGNLFVADSGNGVIRKITPEGEVSTVAGTVGEFGRVDGVGAAVRFGLLSSLAVGPNGNLYVVDSSRIRKITPQGVVSTIAGGGLTQIYNGNETVPALSLGLWYTTGIAVDAGANIFINDLGGVLKITAAGIASRFTTLVDGVELTDLRWDAEGNLLAVNPTDGSIIRIAPDGSTEELGPRYTAPYPARYINAAAVTSDGDIWVAQLWEHAVGRLPGAGAVPQTIAKYNPIEHAPVTFYEPWAIVAAPQGGIYLSDIATHSIQHVAADGTVTMIAGQGAKTGFDGPRSEAVFIYPTNVASADGRNVYILDNWRIRKVDLSTGTVSSVAYFEDSPFEPVSGQYWPSFTVDRGGNFFFANYPRGCISRLSASGEWSIVAGSQTEREVRDGIGTDARFNSPRSISIDGAGNLYVADNDAGHVVRRISPTGQVTTIAGSATTYGSVDGPRLDARFNYIIHIAATPRGAVWVGEFNVLRHISEDGIVSTIAGDPAQQYPDGPDGQGDEVVFANIQDLAVIDEETVLLLDSPPGNLRHVTRAGVVTTIPQTGRYALAGDTGFFALTADSTGRFLIVGARDRRILTGLLTPDAGRLANLSVLKRVGDGGSKLTVGFVAEGDTPKTTLVRAVGPTLANHGITSGFMTDPKLELFDRNGARVGTIDDWTNDDVLIDTSQRLGAFPLDAASTDASTLHDIPGGPFTATVSAADGAAGQVLVEVYDADLEGMTRLTNLSTLTPVSPGGGRLIAGFVITGEDEKTVLIRGVGPSLTQFGLPASQVLGDPRIRLFRGTEVIAENDDWKGEPLLVPAFNAVGAFALLDEDTPDAALLVKLGAGSYTVHLESADGSTGQAIVEVYEVK